MDKLKMQTPNLIDKNMEQIAKLFPNVMTEIKDESGISKKAIDFDLLKQCLSDVLIDDEDERYRLDWPGKKASLLKANTPISKTLRPCREDSVDFDTTENVYIEGDNFEVLKILQESYLGKIKMIYIDPPYNTGSDFLYKDDFKVSKDEYAEEIGAVDEEGDRLFKNTDSNGRFHSDWLSMMYERLIVAKDLLKDDGVIFISIDDNEMHNLRKICDDIFGDENFIVNFIWEKHKAPKNDNKYVTENHEYILMYSKYKDNYVLNKLPRSEKNISSFSNPDNDPRGVWISGPLLAPTYSEKSVFEIKKPNGDIAIPPQGKCWAFSSLRIIELINDNRIWFGKDGKNVPRIKRFLSELSDSIGPTSMLLHDDLSGTQKASNFLKKVFGGSKIFTYPKPIEILDRFLRIATNENDIIMDFFSGSATTAHAVMQLNAEDNGNRKFIMVQLPEITDEKSEAYKAGYKTIPDIGKERIRRAGKMINKELEEKNKQLKLGEEPIDTAKLDIGFRVFKTDSTNMKDVYYHPEKLPQEQLSFLESNIKEDRTSDDLLTQVILDLGLEINLPIENKEILGNSVFIVQHNALVACFDNNINFKIVDEIAELKPFKVVFKDASFTEDKDRINVEERFKRLSPETVITVV